METKASIVERVNRSIKSKMWKAFTRNGDLRYVELLLKLLKSYNNTYHSSIKMKPIMVSPETQEMVWQNVYGAKSPVKRMKKQRSNKNQLKTGDRVRISMVKRPFKKGYLPQWSEEMFTVVSRVPGETPLYKIEDDASETLEGTFYQEEVQKVDKSDGVYRIDSILEEKKVRGETQYLVKWKGYSNKFNSWIKTSDLRKHS